MTPGLASVVTFVLVSQYLAAIALVAFDSFAIGRARHPRASDAFWVVVALLTIANALKFATGKWSSPFVLGLTGGLVLAAITYARSRVWIRTVCADLGAIAVIGTVYWVVALHVPVVASPRVVPSEVAVPGGPTILIVFDELGKKAVSLDDQIDSALFPSFARLARDGMYVTNGTTNYTVSCSAMSSMFRGKFVPSEGDDASHCGEFLVGETSNLFAWVAPSARVAIYEEYLKGCRHPGAALCRDMPFLAVNFPISAIVARLIPLGDRVGMIGEAFPPTIGLYDREMLAMLRSDLRAFGASPVVYWMHVLLPHFPFVLDVDGRLSTQGTTGFSDRGFDDASAYYRYREQVRFADTMLGQVLATLDELGLTNQTHLVVTGDHGPRYPMPEDPANLTPLRDDTPRVPVFVLAPGVRGGAQPIDYQSVDFAPTVLDLLGLPIPDGLDGVSILALNRPQRVKRVSTVTGHFALDPATGQWHRE